MSGPSKLAVSVALILGGLSPLPAAGTPSSAQPPSGKVLFAIQAPALKELSGLAVSDSADAYYAIQDAGNDPTLFVLGPDGRELGALPVPYPDTDWEDLALFRRPGQTGVLYIADTGDESVVRKSKKLGPRKEFALIRLEEPSANLPQTLRVAEATASFPVTFADGESHNVESILVDPATERVYLIDKSPPKGNPAGVWEGPPALSAKGNRFEQIATLPTTGISSASFSPGGRLVAIRDADTAYIWRTGSAGLAAALHTRPTTIPLPAEPQGESLTFKPDGADLIIGSEGIENPVLAVPLPAELRDPLYPFTPAARPDRALLYTSAFVGAALLAAAIGADLLRRRRSRR